MKFVISSPSDFLPLLCSSAVDSISVLTPRVLLPFLLCEQLFALTGCCKPKNQPRVVRQFHLPTNSSAAVVLGHKYLGADPQTRNYSYRQSNIGLCLSTQHNTFALLGEREGNGVSLCNNTCMQHIAIE